MDIQQIIIQTISEVLHEEGEQYVNDLKNRLGNQGLTDSNLFNTITFTVNGSTLSINMADYADFVDQGRSPGKQPPPDAIEKWVRSKGLTMDGSSQPLERQQKSLSFLIGRKIGEEGTQPQPFLDPDPTDKILNSINKKLEQRIYNEIMK